MIRALIFLILAACSGSNPPAAQIYTFEPSVQTHINAYLAYKQAILGQPAWRTVSISLGEPQYPNQAGYCRPSTGEIVLNKDLWFTLPFTMQEQLVMHELFHCDLGMHEHFTLSQDIMNEQLLPDFIYRLNRDYLIKKVFKRLSFFTGNR